MSTPHPSAATNRPVRVCYNGIAYKAYRGVRAYEFARVYPAGTTVYPLHRLCVGTCLGASSLSPSLLTLAAAGAAARPNPNQRRSATRYPVTSGFRFCIDNTKQLVPMTSNSAYCRFTDTLVNNILPAPLVPARCRSLPSLELSVTARRFPSAMDYYQTNRVDYYWTTASRGLQTERLRERENDKPTSKAFATAVP